MPATPHAALEFFAGIGLVRAGLAAAGFTVVYANDVEPFKRDFYTANFGDEHFDLRDIRDVSAADLPTASIAAASFPCTDLSLAGNRAGLAGNQSGLFWEFARLLRELGDRRPVAVMLENVTSLASSRGGADLEAIITELNDQGYWCDIVAVDAKHFTPQSRPRMFVVAGLRSAADFVADGDWDESPLRPRWLKKFVYTHPHLDLRPRRATLPDTPPPTLEHVVERLAAADGRWWPARRLDAFVASLSHTNKQRLAELRDRPSLTWRTAYRRTRNGAPTWEIRPDSISGCLRTARGGSSKQALVQTGHGEVRVRWCTAREYARLQGADTYHMAAGRSETQALSGFGDAVCVPAVAWVARTFLRPITDTAQAAQRTQRPPAADGPRCLTSDL